MKFLLVAGARPNFIKIAPILDAFRCYADTHEIRMVHTGQHYDARMSTDFFHDLGIPEPDFNLGVGSATHAEQTARVMVAFEQICFKETPDWAVVVGDVNSTMACAVTAKKLGIRVAHVEAGLRSGDMSMPEEVNRLCTDAVSDLLFTTDEIANQNLRREGVPAEKICFVGNTMIDTLLRHIDRARSIAPLNGYASGKFAVLTLHRPSNVDREETLRGILDAIVSLAARIPVVFPVHPRTRKRLEEFGVSESIQSNPGFTLIEPLSYLPFIGLVSHSQMVLTDSGGIQEETTVLGIPCLTIRGNTERPVTCNHGTNLLVGVDRRAIENAALSVLDGRVRPGRVPERWDGKAAQRIVEVLVKQAQAAVAQ